MPTVRRLLPAVAVVLGCAAPSSAQDGVTVDSYRGLFGTSDITSLATPRPARSGPFDLTVNVSNLFETQASSSVASKGEGPRTDNSHGALDLVVAHRRPGKRLLVDVRAGSQLRRYLDTRGVEADQQWATVNAEARLTRRTSVTVSSRAAYSPMYLFSLPLAGPSDPGDPGPSLNLEVGAQRSTSVASTVAVSRRMGRRTVADASYGLAHVALLDADRTLTSQRAAGRVSWALDDGLSMRVGYDHGRVDDTQAGGSSSTVTHETAIGVHYVLPASPGTSVTVSAIPTLLQRHVSPSLRLRGDLPSDGARVGALVRADQQISSLWRAEIGYQRALYNNDGYIQPVFAQTASLRLEGRVSRRLEVSGSAAYSAGLARAQAAGSMIDSFGYSMRGSYRASTFTAIYVECSRVTTVESGGIGPSSASRPLLARAGVRVGVVVRAR